MSIFTLKSTFCQKDISPQLAVLVKVHRNHGVELEGKKIENVQLQKKITQLKTQGNAYMGKVHREMGRLQAEVAELKAEMERREELCKEHMEAFNRRNAEAEHMKEGMSSKVELLEKRLGDVEDLLKEEEKKLKETQEHSKEHEGNIRSLNQELVAAKENKEILERDLQAKLTASADEVTELNGQVSAYAEELRGTKEREAEQTQKMQAGALELAAKEEKIKLLETGSVRLSNDHRHQHYEESAEAGAS